MSYNPLVKIHHKTKAIGKFKIISDLINNNPDLPIYALYRSVSSTNEGTSVTFTLSTLNVADGTSVPYSLGGITLDDLASGSLTGSFVVYSGSASKSFTISNDTKLEGNETMSLTAAGQVADNILIIDSSIPVESPEPPVVPIPPDYTLTRSASAINEGQSVTYTLSSASFQYGDVIPYMITGSGITEADFLSGSMQGNFVIGYDNTATVTFVVNEDYFTETSGETMLLSALGGFADPVTINDTSKSPVYQSNAPTYSLTRLGPEYINELDTVTFVLNTTNVPDGTLVPYKLRGGGNITQEDFFYWWEPLVSDFVVYNNQASVTYNTSGDGLLEGLETLYMVLINKPNWTYVRIRDTSWTPAPVYTLKASSSAINEGTTVTYTLSADRGVDGTLVPYFIKSYYNRINSADFSNGTMTGNFVLSGLTATVSLTLANDQMKEGPEMIRMNVQGKYADTWVNDTSLNPVYVISRSSTTANEGTTVTYTLSTLRVAEGVEVPYKVYGSNGTVINSADFTDGVMTGSFFVDANGMASTSFTLANDELTENTEYMTLSAAANVAPSTITINDTSKTQVYTLSRTPATGSINEGQTITYTLNTTNVLSGTEVPYTITGITQDDLALGEVSGVFTIINNTASITLKLLADITTEGTETITIVADTHVGTRTQTTDVVDTSITPEYVLLLVGDGNDGGNNNVVVSDASSHGHKLIANTPTLSYDEPSGSIRFNKASRDVIDVEPSSEFEFGTGDFTVECWVYHSTTNSWPAILEIGNHAAAGGVLFYTTNVSATTNMLRVVLHNHTTPYYPTNTTQIHLNAWNHLVWQRKDGYLKIYVNGVGSSNLLCESNFYDISKITIGAPRPTNYDVAHSLDGYLAGLRVVKGTALYSDNFTPSNAPFTEVAGTSLLLNSAPVVQNVVDSTGKNPVIQTYGSSQITTNDKVLTTGSLKFTGVTLGMADYLQIPASADLALGVSDFTVAFWCNFTDVTGTDRYIYSQGAHGTTRISIHANVTTGLIRMWYNGGALVTTGISVNDGNWHHIAFVRQSNVVKCYVDGVLKNTSGAFTANLSDVTTPHYIGTYNGSNTAYAYEGFLDEFSIIKGQAVYTENFDLPAVPTYSLKQSVDTVAEGGSVTYTLKTRNVADGTVIPYAITGITQDDLDSGSINGSFTVASNTASVTLTLAINLATENESINFVVSTPSGTRKQTTKIVDTLTSLLLNGNGPDGGNNMGNIIDISNTNLSVSARFGNPTTSTDAPIVGEYSTKFTASQQDMFVFGNNSAFEFGTEDFTIEFWMKGSATSGSWAGMIATQDIFDFTPTGMWRITNKFSGTNNLGISISNNGSVGDYNLNSANVNDGNWHHIAIVRSNGSITGFVDGIKGTTYNTNITKLSLNSGRNLLIACQKRNNAYYEGYLSNIRIVKGTALYTSNFTPDGPLTNISGTTLLLKSDPTNYIIDASGNNTVIQTFGGAQITTSNAVYGTGSLKFDGVGDYLKIPSGIDMALGTRDFTVEFWINTMSTKLAGIYVSSMFQIYLENSDSTHLRRINGGINVMWSTTSNSNHMDTITPVNDGAWHHIALTRQGNVHRLFRDGLKECELTFAASNLTGTTNHLIGTYNGSNQFLNGLLDDFRITKGVALYTADFTPPQQELLPY